MNNFWQEQMQGHIKVMNDLRDSSYELEKISKAAEIMLRALSNKHSVLFCGNGGSAADSQHLAAELVGRFGFDREALPAEALTVNTSILTAIGNDYSYDVIFARQVRARGRVGDVLFCLSTSGNSSNVVAAAKEAKGLGMSVISLVGSNQQCKLAEVSDVLISIPSTSTPRIQEAHILVGHMLCDYMERKLFLAEA
jgi:D-sedoheptulose 7-phosphate isomerase